jgi:Predicted transcriptional regulator containing an HTH domain and an uncharacterized domain shared with the mammalian protein Schlafen
VLCVTLYRHSTCSNSSSNTSGSVLFGGHLPCCAELLSTVQAVRTSQLRMQTKISKALIHKYISNLAHCHWNDNELWIKLQFCVSSCRHYLLSCPPRGVRIVLSLQTHVCSDSSWNSTCDNFLSCQTFSVHSKSDVFAKWHLQLIQHC